MGRQSLLFHHETSLSVHHLRGHRSGLQQLTSFNHARLRSVQFGELTEMWFPGAAEERVHSWLIRPSNFDPTRKYPLACVIHGGPQGAILDGWHYRWNPQTLATRGFAVLCINFHGSTGFGQSFTDSISGDWGGKPFEDIMKGLDCALKNNLWLDPNRVCALGASYGGYMVRTVSRALLLCDTDPDQLDQRQHGSFQVSGEPRRRVQPPEHVL